MLETLLKMIEEKSEQEKKAHGVVESKKKGLLSGGGGDGPMASMGIGSMGASMGLQQK